MKTKTKKSGQWNDMKKWTTDEGYTFLAKDKKDAEDFASHANLNLGTLKELSVEKSN